MNYKEEIKKLEETRTKLQQEANFQLGAIQGRIELLQELDKAEEEKGKEDTNEK